MSFLDFGLEPHLFWGRLTDQEKVGLRLTLESVGDTFNPISFLRFVPKTLFWSFGSERMGLG